MAKGNQDALPLDQQSCERANPHSGLVETLPALHPAWCSDVQFLPFTAPGTNSSGSSGLLDALWVEAIELIDADLHWLLLLPHQKFWCEVMYNQSLYKMLDSYLRFAPRSHDESPLKQKPMGVQDTMRNIHRRVFMTFLRMSTHKESRDHFLSPEVFAEIIYDHFLFDIPKLLDLCSLYGAGNRELLSKMLGNVFEKQPNYLGDLHSALGSIVKAMERLTAECLGKGGESTAAKGSLKRGKSQSLTPSQITDLILYLADISSTLQIFLDVYPAACMEVARAGFVHRLVMFYESTLPTLQDHWHAQKHNIISSVYVKSRLRQAKHDLAWLVHALLHASYLSPEAGDKGAWDSPEEEGGARKSNSDLCSQESFVACVSSILAEKAFLREFQRHFDFRDLIGQVQWSHSDWDRTQFEYILSALGASKAMPPNNLASEGATSVQPLVAPVKDLFPHLETEFIEACLREYGNDPEAVINHVLEGSLPPHLKSMQTTESIGGKDQTASPSGAERPAVRVEEGMEGGLSLVDQRSSVFDNDEFDVFRKDDVDLNRVQIGKKFDGATTSAVLDDKSHLTSTRDHYRSYQFRVEGVEDGEEGGASLDGIAYEFDQYNDEYDDTYDSHNVGAADADSADELFTIKRLNVKGMYRRQFVVPEEEEEGEGEGVMGWEQQMAYRYAPRTRVLPVRVVQQEAAAVSEDRREGGGRGGGGRGRGRRGGRGGGGGRDEVRSRQLKEKHKSSHGNHSRKYLSDRKRGRGMGGPPR